MHTGTSDLSSQLRKALLELELCRQDALQEKENHDVSELGVREVITSGRGKT